MKKLVPEPRAFTKQDLIDSLAAPIIRDFAKVGITDQKVAEVVARLLDAKLPPKEFINKGEIVRSDERYEDNRAIEAAVRLYLSLKYPNKAETQKFGDLTVQVINYNDYAEKKAE